MDWNVKIYNLLNQFFSAIENLGIGLAILAWFSVFFVAFAMAIVLSRASMGKIWIPSLVVGVVSLVAHILDYYVTLQISPTLREEANPIWRIVVDNFGIGVARIYGFTGKLLLAILSFEFFSYYLMQRERFFPKQASNFFCFWQGFGTGNGKKLTLRWGNITNLFSFVFALIGPFYFYVLFVNSLVDNPLYFRMPSVLLILFLYVVVLLIAYFVVTYRAFRHSNL